MSRWIVDGQSRAQSSLHPSILAQSWWRFSLNNSKSCIYRLLETIYNSLQRWVYHQRFKANPLLCLRSPIIWTAVESLCRFLVQKPNATTWDGGSKAISGTSAISDCNGAKKFWMQFKQMLWNSLLEQAWNSSKIQKSTWNWNSSLLDSEKRAEETKTCCSIHQLRTAPSLDLDNTESDPWIHVTDKSRYSFHP